MRIQKHEKLKIDKQELNNNNINISNIILDNYYDLKKIANVVAV